MKMSRRRLTRASLLRSGRVAALAAPPRPDPLNRPVGRPAADPSDASHRLQASVSDDLLEKARTQWQHGDWDSLRALDPARLEEHPERARLALLVAAAHLQSARSDDARPWIRRAVDWGCSRRLVSQVLVAGLHNTLGRASSVMGQKDKARNHFEQSIATVQPGTDVRLLAHARAVQEMVSLGMLPQAAAYISEAAALARQPQRNSQHLRAHQQVVDIELDMLRNRIVSLQKQLAQGRNVQAIVKPERSAQAASATSSPAHAAAAAYHGLHGLDRKLEAYIGYDGGFFVELGANDGVDQSNTLYFERQRGWRGVLIEPILHNFLKCKANRSSDNAFFCAAAVSQAYEHPYVRLTYSNLMTAPAGLESDIDDPDAHARAGAVYLPSGEQPVETMAVARTLTSMLSEAGAPRTMDLLSLDVEGAELEVLKGLDHDRFRFRYLLVECRDPQRLARFLDQVGYALVDKISHMDYLFCAREQP